MAADQAGAGAARSFDTGKSPGTPGSRDCLPSWNDNRTKQTILAFIQAGSDPGSAHFVPPVERVATFDNDGTLWLEKPLYIQLQHGLHAIGKMAAETPEVRDRQPFKAVYEKDMAWLGQVANLVTWVATIVTVLLLTPLFATLPEAVLAALIIHAVWHIIVARKLRRIFAVSRTEATLGALALLGVLLIDVLQGMLIGVVASLVLVIYRSSRPHISALGRVPGVPGAYTALERHPENVPVPGLMILRLDSPMMYYNAITIRDHLKAMIAAADPPPRAVILDAAVQDELDLTSAEVLGGFLKEMQGAGIAIYVAELHAPIAQFAQRAGLAGILGEGHRFPTVDAAVRALES